MSSHYNRIKRLLGLLYFLLLVSTNIQAFPVTITARPFPFFFNLYSNEIFEIHQDREGFMWFGTTSALVRYDGCYLRTFRNDYNHPQLLTSDNIVYMDDNSHYLWVGTSNGVTLFDKQTWRTHILDDKRILNHVANDIKTDPSTDEVWVASGNHIYRCSADGRHIKGYILKSGAADDGFNQLYLDHSNRLWAMTRNGLFVYDKRRDLFHQYPAMPDGASPYTMFEDSQGHYWIGTWGEGLYRFFPNIPTGCYKRQTLKISGTNVDDPVIYNIEQDNYYGYIWLLSYNELHALKYQNGHLVPVDISNILDPHKMFTRIEKDREGNLWLGSYDMGCLISFEQSGIENFPMSDVSSITGHDVNITSLYYDGRCLWMNQDRLGLLLYNESTKKITPCSSLIDKYGELLDFMPSRLGGVWARRRDGCSAVRLDHNLIIEDRIDLSKNLDNPGTIEQICEDGHGNLWILTTSGLFIHYPGSSTITSLIFGSRRPDNIITDAQGRIYVVKNQRLFLSTYNGSDISLKLKGKLSFLSASEEIAKSCFSKDGRLWLVTNLGRIIASDAMLKVFTPIYNMSTADGMLLDLISSHGRVWVMTNKKIISFNTRTCQSTVFSANNGNIFVDAFRGYSICPDGNGGVFAAGHGGVVRLPKSLFLSNVVFSPSFRMTDVLVGDSSVIFDNPDSKTHGSSVILSPSSHDIKIIFSPMRYAPTPERTVQYCLDGIDNGWVNVNDGQYTATYTTLPKGNYRFFVRYQQQNGRWSHPQEILTLVRKPAFYESNLAFIFYVLLIALLIYCIIRSIQKHSRSEALQHYHSQEKVAEIVANTENTENAGEIDNAFAKAVTSMIEKHMAETDYGQDQLAADLLLSRSTLYRRVKGMSGMSPSEFIRNVKMHKAMEMLKTKEHSISEIAYDLGFSSPKYFTKCFKEETGMTPSEYQKNH